MRRINVIHLFVKLYCFVSWICVPCLSSISSLFSTAYSESYAEPRTEYTKQTAKETAEYIPYFSESGKTNSLIK